MLVKRRRPSLEQLQR